jgi:GntR family transcriptional regulator
MFINEGARKLLLRGEREKFLAEEWPRVQEAIERLGFTAEELLNGTGKRNGKPKSDKEGR